MSNRRLFAGPALRALRQRRGLLQAEMAGTLGISASYLSQLETDERHLTPALSDALRAAFPIDWADLEPADGDRMAEALREALADPELNGTIPGEQIERLARRILLPIDPALPSRSLPIAPARPRAGAGPRCWPR